MSIAVGQGAPVRGVRQGLENVSLRVFEFVNKMLDTRSSRLLPSLKV